MPVEFVLGFKSGWDINWITTREKKNYVSVKTSWRAERAVVEKVRRPVRYDENSQSRWLANTRTRGDRVENQRVQSPCFKRTRRYSDFVIIIIIITPDDC